MKKIMGLCMLLFCCGKSFAVPAEIILIRHGEKPSVGNELNSQGQERAKELVGFFTEDPRVLSFGSPVAIYAMDPGLKDDSLRPIQTITPTADALHLPVYHPYSKDQTRKLVKEILGTDAYSGKTVIVCWEHKKIADILELLGVNTPPASAKWPGDVFNWALVIDLNSQGQPIRFQQIEQNLPMDGVERLSPPG